MERRLLYKLTSMGEDERLIGILGLRGYSINQSSEYDLLVDLVTFRVFVKRKNYSLATSSCERNS